MTKSVEKLMRNRGKEKGGSRGPGRGRGRYFQEGKKAKRILVLVCFLFWVCPGLFGAKAQIQPPQGSVTDLSHVIKDEDRQMMESVIAGLKKNNGAEIAVLVVPNWDTVTEIRRPGEKGKDNGVLFVVCTKHEHNIHGYSWYNYHIDVGSGLKGVLPDHRVDRIKERFVHADICMGHFGPAILWGVVALAQAIDPANADSYPRLAGRPTPPGSYAASEEDEKHRMSDGLAIAMVFGGMILVAAVILSFRDLVRLVIKAVSTGPGR